MASEKEPLNYAAAYAELEKILSEIQNEEINLDEMTKAIRRAKELIQFCQARLRNLEGEVAEIFSDQNDA